MSKKSILLVDDDPLILITVRKQLEQYEFEIESAASGEIAVEMLDKKKYDVVITDMIMYQIDGLGVLKKAKEKEQETIVIILTAQSDVSSAIEALRLKADDYLLKPCEPDEVYVRINNCLEKLELKRKLKIYENILPVCCVCKKIRDDSGKEPGTGDWMVVEQYLHKETKIDITSGYCPDCAEKIEYELGLAEINLIS
jgi:DNA-binding response OmpR family regulator